MALIDQGYKKLDYASAGVKEIIGFSFICAQTASHLSQLNLIDPPMIRINLVPIVIGTISGHGLPCTSSDFKHGDTCCHATLGKVSSCKGGCAIMQMLYT